jgi:acyl carrier protein
VTSQEIEDVVIGAVRSLNLARTPESQIAVGRDAILFGPGSPLDSLGLVALLIDLEEALQDRGLEITLSDDRAMSESRSPFRSVPTLVAYIRHRIDQAG